MNEAKVMNSITPGGRLADASSHNRSPKKNWVEEAGGFPTYMRQVRNALIRKGLTESEATQRAWGILRNWAEGKGNVSPKVRAAAAKAVAQMEAMRARAKAKWLFDDLPLEVKKHYSAEQREEAHTLPDGSFPIEDEEDLKNAIRAVGRAKDPAAARKHICTQARRLGKTDLIPDHWEEKSDALDIEFFDLLYGSDEVVSYAELKMLYGDSILDELAPDPEEPEEKEDQMDLETKTAQTGSVTVLDEDEGIVETLVSVTGIKDNVNDIIEPGAYSESIKTLKPKGIVAHDWKMPVSKPLDYKELMPGDPSLPKELPNGDPWPKQAGAVYVKAQFNLDTQMGRDAFSNVKFFGDDGEWSIGYKVPTGGATKVGNVRHIKTLKWYEYSPVLFGAMPLARTQSVKSMFEHLGVEEEQLVQMPLDEFKTMLEGIGASLEAKEEPLADTYDESEEVKEDEFIFEDDLAEKVAADDFDITAYDYEWLVKTYEAIGDAIDAADAAAAYAEDLEGKALTDVVESHEDALGDFASEMKSAALDFDIAQSSDDIDAMEAAANAVLDVVEKALSSGDTGIGSAAKKVALAVSAMAPDEEKADDEEEDGEDYEEEPEEEEEEAAPPTAKKKLPPFPGRKKDEEQTTMQVKDLQSVGFLTSRRR